MSKDKKEKVRDPVCGMVKPKKDMRASSVFKGKIYYFCTQGDRKMFEAYPEHWITKEGE